MAGAGLARVVPVDGWCGLTLDPATLIKTGGVHESELSEALLPRLFEIEYREPDANQFADLARRASPVAVLDEATEGRPESSVRFREVLAPHGYRHELRLVLRDGGRTWGGFTLLRGQGSRPFGTRERRLLAGLSGPLAAVLRRAVLRADSGRESRPAEAGLLLLDRAHEVASITPVARRSLGYRDGGALPVPVHAVAARAWGSDDGGSAGASARTWSPAGGWTTLSGWRLDPAQVAVSVETIRPEHLTALILDAYGLSAREREVVELVLLGHSTSEIAAKLFLSPYTVQDHVRAVFDKTGVRSRRALLTRLRVHSWLLQQP